MLLDAFVGDQIAERCLIAFCCALGRQAWQPPKRPDSDPDR